MFGSIIFLIKLRDLKRSHIVNKKNTYYTSSFNFENFFTNFELLAYV